jgi:hypothetical protein
MPRRQATPEGLRTVCADLVKTDDGYPGRTQRGHGPVARQLGHHLGCHQQVEPRAGDGVEPVAPGSVVDEALGGERTSARPARVEVTEASAAVVRRCRARPRYASSRHRRRRPAGGCTGRETAPAQRRGGLGGPTVRPRPCRPARIPPRPRRRRRRPYRDRPSRPRPSRPRPYRDRALLGQTCGQPRRGPYDPSSVPAERFRRNEGSFPRAESTPVQEWTALLIRRARAAGQGACRVPTRDPTGRPGRFIRYAGSPRCSPRPHGRCSRRAAGRALWRGPSWRRWPSRRRSPGSPGRAW